MIPKTIFQISPVAPDPLIIEQIKSFANQWEYHHFTNSDAIQFFNDHPLADFPNMIEIFGHLETDAHKLELFKYYVMYIKGGVYICPTGMIETNIESIVKDYSFISVNSCGMPNSIFPGLMGATPHHDIIHTALFNIYHLGHQPYSICQTLYEVIQKSTQCIKFYQEKYYTPGVGQTINEDQQTIFLNYWYTQTIPQRKQITTDVAERPIYQSVNTFMNDKFNILDEQYVCQLIPHQSQIPRILHIIWLNSNIEPIAQPGYVRSNVETWKTLMPDWEVKFWTEEQLLEFPPVVLELIQKANQGAQKADLARYFIIEKYGGFYSDTDVIPYKNLEPLLSLDENQLILCHDLPITWAYISIGFFGAIPHHPVFQKACELSLVAELNTSDLHLKTGPKLMGESVYQTPIQDQKHLLLPSKYFYHNDDYPQRFGNHFYAKEW